VDVSNAGFVNDDCRNGADRIVERPHFNRLELNAERLDLSRGQLNGGASDG
jgi:hypothetical protein